jgi:hypothetical protein
MVRFVLCCSFIKHALQAIDILFTIQPEKQKLQSGMKKRLEVPSIVFESRISELEAQLTQTKMDLRKALEEADLYKKKLADQPLSFETHTQFSAADCDSHRQQIEKLQRLVKRRTFLYVMCPVHYTLYVLTTPQITNYGVPEVFALLGC